MKNLHNKIKREPIKRENDSDSALTQVLMPIASVCESELFENPVRVYSLFWLSVKTAMTEN